ncbi:MAG: AtpZ/AtpI family protein [Elusimicrobiota bacterium]
MDKHLKNIRSIGWASSVGLMLVFSTVLGFALGLAVDKFFNTSPWFAMICLIIGIVAGFRNVFISLKVINALSDNGKNGKK